MRRKIPLFSPGVWIALALVITSSFVAAQGENPFAQPAEPASFDPSAAPAPSPTPVDNLLAAPLPSEIPGAPAAPAAGVNVEDLSSQEGLAQQRQVKDLQEQIRKLFSESQFEAAIDKCEELLRLDPTNSTALLLRERAQRYLVSNSAPPTPVVAAAPLATTPVPLDPSQVAPPATDANNPAAVPPVADSAPVAPPVVPLESSSKISPLMIIAIVVVVLVIIAAAVVVFLKRRGPQVPVIPKAAAPAAGAGGYLAAAGSGVTQPGYFEFDDMSHSPTKPAPFYDQKTTFEGNREFSSGQTPLPTADDFISNGALDDMEEEPVAASASGAANAAQAQPEPSGRREPSASRVDIDLGSIMVDAAPAAQDAPHPPAESPMDIAAAAAPEPAPASVPPKAPAPLKPKAPQPPAIPIDISGMAAPEKESPKPASGERPSPPAAMDFAPASLFETKPAEQTASGNPNALSYNSLMFGNDATQDNISRDAPASSADDLTLNTFNKEYSNLMFGSVGEETKMPPGMAAEEAPKQATAPAKVPDQIVIHDQPVTSLEATAVLTPAATSGKPGEGDQTAIVNPPGAPKISMFDRQRAAGMAALASGDFAKAVHCLSIAASLKPTDKEVRELLEDARAKKAAAAHKS